MFEFLVGLAAAICICSCKLRAIYIWNHLNKKLDIDISKKTK
jgi:hypothetical protein